jgi:hypothetical protein
MKGGIVPTCARPAPRAGHLPREHFALYRSFVDCDPAPSDACN